MKSILVIIILLLFFNCNPNKSKRFYFPSVGWKVSVPAFLKIVDSATYYKSPVKPANGSEDETSKAGAPYAAENPPSRNFGQTGQNNFPYRILLSVVDTGAWRVNATSLVADIRPLASGKEGWDEDLRSMRTGLAEAYNKDYLPRAIIDSVFSKEKIDGKIFDKSYFRIARSAFVQNIMVYSRQINEYAFHCAIYYSDTVRGRLFTNILENSKFDK